MMPMKVVLITGNAPYLGGPRTWLPLRRALPDVTFSEVDPLDFAGCLDMARALRAGLEQALRGANAVVAHGLAAGVAIEAVANVNSAIGVVLLAPGYLARANTAARLMSGLLAVSAVAGTLVTVARSKHNRLLRDDAYVRKQLEFMVRRDAIDDGLVKEAGERIRDPRMRQVIEQTAAVVQAALRPIDPAADAAVRNRTALGARMRSSPMLEAPEMVASALRSLWSPAAV
jgi:hypothetical protein